MGLARLYKMISDDPGLSEGRLLDVVYHELPDVRIEAEICFYILFTKERDESDIPIEEWKMIKRILGDPWNEKNLTTESSLVTDRNSTTEILLEIGPKMTFTTAWSTNCTGIFTSAGIASVGRVEKSRRYLLKFPRPITDSDRNKVISILCDPMIEQTYDSPLESFCLDKKPEIWTRVDILQRGKDALQHANDSMGLAMDEWDLEYYSHLFKDKLKRNPTTVELFDLAQSNSEHSRHWFFKGMYEVEGKRYSSLFDMVMETNSPKFTNKNNVLKFSDNSSGIVGWEIPVMFSTNPHEASPFGISDRLRNIIFTSETHNFPTGVSPFSGATTGTGGRIRDIQAAGRGGHVIAGTAGYCFGNLFIPDHQSEWELTKASCPNFASALQVAIEGSNGASDYGNKFGEPVICGFARSFGMILGNGSEDQEHREWVKPIMFSGGIGSLDNRMVLKKSPSKDDLVVKLGGPAYRIGVGGGAASSIQIQGDNSASRDLGAVQRGDAEMKQKLNRVIRSCLELESSNKKNVDFSEGQLDANPILAIHDQGAGGNANVIKELVEEAGGAIFTSEFSVGDKSLSTLEIWGAEYQESNAALVHPSMISTLSSLAKREKCPLDTVGFITGDKKIRLFEKHLTREISEEETCPVDLDMNLILGKMPQKLFKWEKISTENVGFVMPAEVSVVEALSRVLRLPSVASKRYLTNKVDRSVTGLVAQQQCVGPRHTPVADVAVVALSHFSLKGAATSIGEQPIKILVDPKAGARMTVFEALSNLASALITNIKDVKCSANWMWPAKLPGEGWLLYQACQSMCEVMKQLSIAVDGGKDSLSMAARVPPRKGDSSSTVIKAPGSLVVSAYAPCPNIRKVVTPDLKGPRISKDSKLYLLKASPGSFRIGGSALAQTFNQLGSQSPDLDTSEIQNFKRGFNTIQTLIKCDLLSSLHDVSDGGLICCLLEMAIAGWSGCKVFLPSPNNEEEVSSCLRALFNEEVGWVMEIEAKNEGKFLKIIVKNYLCQQLTYLGHTQGFGPASRIQVDILEDLLIDLTVSQVASMWEETSFRIETLQMNSRCAEQEFRAIQTSCPNKSSSLRFKWKPAPADPQWRIPHCPEVAVVREEGSNGDREMAAAFISSGFLVHDVTMTDILKGNVHLDKFRGIVFPGGFSYADVLGSGVGWAASITENENVLAMMKSWRANSNTFSLGVCNGCQLMANIGWIGEVGERPSVKLGCNLSKRFESRWSRIAIQKTNSLFLAGMEDSTLGVWVAHGEGRFIYNGQRSEKALNPFVALRYIDDDNSPTESYPFNPNGSKEGVAGLSSSCGRHLGMMPHPERSFLSWQMPYRDFYSNTLLAPWSKIFQNAFDWCLKN